jgi:hypothetical protein
MTLFSGSGLLLLLLSPSLEAAEPLAFNKDIRPIFSKTCFTCHGPDAAAVKGELRLDIREHALKGGESGKPAIVPGKPEESLMVQRMRSTDPDDTMPPPEAHMKFTPKDAELLTRWIAEGAKYEGHWAFKAPVKPALPPGEAHPVDAFIAARLKSENLALSPEADRRTLIRRVAFDLTGLPPSMDEIRQFLDDASPHAYQTMVDRYLASPRFGENFATPWLDASRYADTNGYSIDGGRQQWLWRDWVIQSFNSNQPYDQFLTDQIAGDLLPGATDQQIVATGFSRNHAITHEGGTIPEENLLNYGADRVKTTTETFLGLTMACAQCHDHKYDPLSQREYYQFYAFFNTIDEAGLAGDGGVNAAPSINAKSCLADPQEEQVVRGELAKLREAIQSPIPAEQAKWEAEQLADLKKRGDGLVVTPLEVVSTTAPNGNPERIKIHPDHSITISGGDFAAYNVLSKLPSSGPPIRGIRIVFSGTEASKGLLGFGKAKELEGNFHLGSVTNSVSSFPATNVDLNAILPIAQLSSSGFQPGYMPSHVLNTDPRVGWAPPTGSTDPHRLTLTFAVPLHPSTTPFLTTELLFNFGKETSPARFQIFAISGNDDDSPHPPAVTALLVNGPAARTPEQAADLRDYYHGIAPEKAGIRYQIANLQDRLSMLTADHSVLVMNTSKKPRKTHVLNRGVYSAPMEEVSPGTPAILPPLSLAPGFDPATGQFHDRPANRLDLARWMTRSDHPLVARVAVNRLWEHFFGRALSASSADLGSQGQWPSHPELLDWLAVDFRENGWDRKRLIRLIISSKTYRQSSSTPAELLASDPSNELLTRGPRFRLSAEQIRDQALAVSGLLIERLGGPSVRPYQPGDLWRQVSHYGSSPATSQTFVQDHGEKLYRRSLYTYWKRTLPPPNLSVFDAPNREICSIGRLPTNTPLQALVTLNDPQFVEAARAFASRMLKLPEMADHERISFAFEEVTSRRPTQAETQILEGSLLRERRHFAKDPTAAKKLLEIGEQEDTNPLSAIEHAAWTQLAATLLNLSETITRK